MNMNRHERHMLRERLLRIQGDLMDISDDFEPHMEKFSDTDKEIHRAMLDAENAIEDIQARFA